MIVEQAQATRTPLSSRAVALGAKHRFSTRTSSYLVQLSLIKRD